MQVERFKRHSGFTLVELSLATMVIAILSFSFLGGYSFLARTSSELATRDRMERLRIAFVAAYRANARGIESSVARQVLLGPGVAVIDQTDGSDASTAVALERIAAYGQLSPFEAQMDDFHGRFRFLVSSRLSSTMTGGYQVNYRKIAIVSPGYNGRVDAGTTMDPATGAVVAAGDDLLVVVDGFQIQRELAEQTAAKIDRIVKAYERYFTDRYLANISRDVSIDYFAASGSTATRWDTAGLAASSGGTFTDASNLNMGQALGFSPADLIDAYGTPIQVDNSSNQTRNPDNPSAAMSIPPYSALVRANLTAGQAYVQSAIGSF